MSAPVLDALGRSVDTAPAQRVVSLVPSETESVVALAGLERLVGRTEWCEEPAGSIEAVPTVGGTKKLDVERVIALGPDLVLANQEENGRRDVERLIESGLRVHVSFPCTIESSVEYVATLACLLGVKAQTVEEQSVQVPARAPLSRRVFVPIWREPWMSLDRRTYGSDLLAHVGLENVFADRARRYPLAADVADAAAVDAGERDTRYPRTSRDEVMERAPDLALLPDEPFRFDDSHVEELLAWGIPDVRLVSGKDLFWYGVRTASAVARLTAAIR